MSSTGDVVPASEYPVGRNSLGFILQSTDSSGDFHRLKNNTSSFIIVFSSLTAVQFFEFSLPHFRKVNSQILHFF